MNGRINIQLSDGHFQSIDKDGGYPGKSNLECFSRSTFDEA